MEDIKVCVNGLSISEKKEVIGLLKNAGYKTHSEDWLLCRFNEWDDVYFFIAYNNSRIEWDSQNAFSCHKNKEITLQELRDLVAKNKSGEVKEYLNPDQNYSLVTHKVGYPTPKNWIAVPDGDDIYISHNNDSHFSFYKFCDNGLNWSLWHEDQKKYGWSDYSEKNLNSEYMKSRKKQILWKREKESIIDSCKNKEQVKEKHSHYKKDVSHLELLDIYRVLELFEVKSHAVGHAVKKLLCSGNRGAKDEKQDIKEAIDSLNRHLEMLGENDEKA